MAEKDQMITGGAVGTHSGSQAHSASSSAGPVRRRPLPDTNTAVLKQARLIGCGLALLAVFGSQLGRKHFPWTYGEVAGLMPVVALLLAIVFLCLDHAPHSAYLVDFACYRPPKELKITKCEFIELAKESGYFDAAAIEFQSRVLQDSGIGDESYMPRWVFRPAEKTASRPRAGALQPLFPPGKATALREGRAEASQVMIGVVDELIAATGVRPRDIRVLVVNCGVMNPTPSLSAMLINRYKLRRDVCSYNLGGMGCAAGATAVGLARDLLMAHPGSLGLVVSTEIVSATWYTGNDHDMLVPNCFFRMGAAALLLSSRRRDRWRSKYEFMQVVRTHRGSDDRSFRCVHMRQDGDLRLGLSVGRNLLEVGAEALKTHIAALAAVLPPTKKSLLSFNLPMPWQLRRMLRRAGSVEKSTGALNLKRAFDHVCVSAAGKRALDEARRVLGLAEEDMEAARRTLERFGNTSSSSVWYELAYLETRGRVLRGHRVLHLALGSGIKCGSVAWRALRDAHRRHRSPWLEEEEEEAGKTESRVVH